MREIVLDTETTGLDPVAGHRIVEIGCLELINGMPTGEKLHVYINPARPMPDEAFRIHGLDDTFLADKPRFEEIADRLVAFLGNDTLVIHNATFDLGFLNAELEKLARPTLTNPFVDTVSVARRKFPGQRNSLDALCERFAIDNTRRTLHGALLDAELLSEVYIELTGGRQRGLALIQGETDDASVVVLAMPTGPRREPRPHSPTAAELAAHEAFLAKLKNPIWLLVE